MGVKRLTKATARTRATLVTVARALTWPARTAHSWWSGLDPAERVLYRAVVLLGAGFAMIWSPLGLIVPGVLFALVFFGFHLRRA